MPIYNYDFCNEIRRYFYARSHHEVWAEVDVGREWQAVRPEDINWMMQPTPIVRRIIEGHYLVHRRNLVAIYNTNYHREMEHPPSTRRNCRKVADISKTHDKMICGIISYDLIIMRGLPKLVKYVVQIATDNSGVSSVMSSGCDKYMMVGPTSHENMQDADYDVLERMYPSEASFNAIE